VFWTWFSGVCVREQGGHLLFSLKRARLVKAKIAEPRTWFCLSISLKRRAIVLGNMSSRSGEHALPKREIVRVLEFCSSISLRRRALFWATKHLAQARGLRLSKKSWKVLCFYLTHRLSEGLRIEAMGNLAQARRSRLSETLH